MIVLVIILFLSRLTSKFKIVKIKRIYIPLPPEEGRKSLFEINLKGIDLGSDVDFDALVSITGGYSGADIANVCRDAAMMPLRKKIAEGAIDILKIKEQ